MFEEELELEKKEQSWGPLLLVIVFVGVIVGVLGYYVLEMRKGLPADEATVIVEKVLKAKTPTLVFRAGKVEASGSEQPKDPHYKVLEKAGLVKLTNVNWATNDVVVTEQGQKVFSSIAGFKTKENADKTIGYEVPLATRKFIKIDSITLKNPTNATVEYEWKWEPNQVGDLFDVDSDSLKGFSTWDHQKLIDKYGADFYHAGPKKQTINLVKGDKGWEINTGF